MPISFCTITATKPSCVAKEFTLNNGELKKKTVANIYEGKLKRTHVSCASEFAKTLMALDTTQCLTYGVPPRDAKLVTENTWAKLGYPDDPLPRIKSVFTWPNGPGILMLDYDARKDGRPSLSRKQLLVAVMAACPTLKQADLVWWASSSSYLYAGDQEITSLKGQRLYVFVKDASDIERAGKVINARLWALGYGHAEVSNAGNVLTRSVFDNSVWQSNHIDFAAGAKCGQGLKQLRGEPLVFGDGSMPLIDTRLALPDLTQEETRLAQENINQQIALVMPNAGVVKEKWTANRVANLMASDSKLSQEQATMIVRRALESRDLSGDWSITIQDHDGSVKKITAAQALDEPTKFHGLLTLDPLEPEYDGGRWVGKLYLKTPRPNLFSFAHGGVVYRLHRQPANIELVKGKSREATDHLLEVLRAAPDIFDFGMELVRIGHEGVLHPLNDSGLRYVVGGLTQFYNSRKLADGTETRLLRDPPADMCKTVIALGDQRSLKKLSGVITAPTLRPDGSLLDTAGYDPKTFLLFDPSGSTAQIPFHPTQHQAREALEYLWSPFKEFPFCSNIDRAVHLCALLTAAVRSSLQSSPGFAYDAPTQGSGKTLLGRCVGVLVQGTPPSVWPHTAGRDDEEIRKRLFTVLRSGAKVLIWDNLVGAFDSPAMASCMTSPTLTDRILGQSSSSTVPNKMLLILTGNNILLQGEMPRRVLVCRIDPATEQPFAREFNLDPYHFCAANRQQMIAAALTVIRAHLTHGCSVHISGKLASFEDWDTWVRRATIYANELMPGQFGDVMHAVMKNQTVDPEQEVLSDFLKAWEDHFSNSAIVLADLISAASIATPIQSQKNLKEALEGLTGRSIQQLTSKSLGRSLGYRKGRIAGGRFLELGAKVNDRQTWRVKQSRRLNDAGI